MLRLLIAGMLLVATGLVASADTLTAPITTTATQYAVQSVTFNLVAQVVEVRVALLDSAGAVIKTVTTQTTFAQFPFAPAQQATLAGWVVAYLKAQGIVN